MLSLILGKILKVTWLKSYYHKIFNLIFNGVSPINITLSALMIADSYYMCNDASYEYVQKYRP